MMSYDELMETALCKLSKVGFGQVFVLKDLFEGCFWNRLPIGDRLAFGKYFKRQVELQYLSLIHISYFVGMLLDNQPPFPQKRRDEGSPAQK